MTRFAKTTMSQGSSSWRRPLPDGLAELAPRAVREQHEELADRHVRAGADVVELTARLQSARATDEVNAHEAMLAGGKLQSPTAPSVEDALDDARRELAAAAGALPESASRLLAACESSADQALMQAEAEREVMLEVLAEQVDQVLPQLLAELAVKDHEVGWLAELAEQAPSVAVWRATPSAAAEFNSIKFGLRECAEAVERLATRHLRRAPVGATTGGDLRLVSGHAARRKAAGEVVERGATSR